jgi:hypothetical protein
MFETTPPQPLPDGVDLADLAELADPVAAVVAAELTARFIQLCMGQAEPVVSRLARSEVTLRKPGGIDLEKMTLAQLLYRQIEAKVFRQLSRTVPLSHAEFALSRIEVLLREQFADVVGTAASYLLSDGRDVAIQMTAVAATMAAREVRRGMVGIIGQTRPDDADRDEEGM